MKTDSTQKKNISVTIIRDIIDFLRLSMTLCVRTYTKICMLIVNKAAVTSLLLVSSKRYVLSKMLSENYNIEKETTRG